jgi:tetratricopeptide (TPR) repeat protein
MKNYFCPPLKALRPEFVFVVLTFGACLVSTAKAAPPESKSPSNEKRVVFDPITKTYKPTDGSSKPTDGSNLPKAVWDPVTKSYRVGSESNSATSPKSNSAYIHDLKEISFSSLYSVPFYQKSYFSWLILGATVLTSCVVVFFSAGAGAPAAATGVSTVASWIAGGGAGSYMSGLATVGACIGGNAMTGAAILNGISLALGGTFTTGVVSTVLAAAMFTATAIDGVAPLMNGPAGRLHYTVRISPPSDIGSTRVRAIVKEMANLRERQAKILQEITKQGNLESIDKNPRLQEVSKSYVNLMIEARDMLDKGLDSNQISTSDLLVLAIINYGSGEEGSLESFQQAVSRLSDRTDKVSKSTFLDYLIAIKYLSNEENDKAKALLDEICAKEPYAIEPAVLKLNLLSPDFLHSEPRMIGAINHLKKNYSSDNYKTDLTLVAPYYRMATIYYLNGRYPEARDYYGKAQAEIGLVEKLLGDPSLSRDVRLGMINSTYKMGDRSKAGKMYEDLIKNLKYEEIKNLDARYAGTTN